MPCDRALALRSEQSGSLACLVGPVPLGKTQEAGDTITLASIATRDRAFG